LISFPTLTALGVPGVQANATNTVALVPGYVGGVAAQRADLRGLGRQSRPQLIAGAIGGLVGSVLLVASSESLFRALVPYLILFSTVLMAAQDRLRAWIFRPGHDHRTHTVAQTVCVGLAAVYGGYFGAGLGIVLIAVLGLFSDQPLNRLNAVKLLLASVINFTAALFLATSDKVEWPLVAVMAPCALLGGHIGGRWASVIPAKRLRLCVIAIGLIVSIVYFLR